MTKSTLNQDQWVELFRQQPDFPIKGNPRSTIFFNPTNHVSMRLTNTGCKYLIKHLKLKSYEFKLAKAITPKILLQLERQLHSVYYIAHVHKVVVFDETTAIMLQLHGSDLETYLDNLEQHQ